MTLRIRPDGQGYLYSDAQQRVVGRRQNNGDDDFAFRVLAASAVQSSFTGAAEERLLASVPIPAGALGPNGLLRVTTLITNNNSANNKTLRWRLGGIAGTELLVVLATTNVTYHTQRTFWNRNSESSQIGPPSALANVMAPTSTAPATAAVNTAQATTLAITGQLIDGADTISLESYLVELCYRP